MKLFGILFLFSLLVLTSCAQPEKGGPPASPPLANQEKPANTGSVGPIHVSLKDYKMNRTAGVMHLVSDGTLFHVEVLLEGMKPGPYKINLNGSKNCKNIRISKGQDIGELIDDGKGNAKTTFDLNLPAKDVIGKKVVIYSKDKRLIQVDACGVAEKI